MFDIELRNIKDRLLNPVANAVSKFASPTAVSITGFAFGVASLYALGSGMPVLALILWYANRILDGLDGAVARVSGRTTDAGGFLDITLDFVLYAAFPIVLAIVGMRARAELPVNGLLAFTSQLPWLDSAAPGIRELIPAALLLASFYVNAAVWMTASALFEKRRQNQTIENTGRITSMKMPRSLVEGFETIVFFSLMIVLPRFFAELALTMTILVIVGFVVRGLHTYRTLKISQVNTESPRSKT